MPGELVLVQEVEEAGRKDFSRESDHTVRLCQRLSIGGGGRVKRQVEGVLKETTLKGSLICVSWN